MLFFRYYHYLRQFLIKQFPGFFSFLVDFKEAVKYGIISSTLLAINLLFLFIFYQLLVVPIVYSTIFAWLSAFIIIFSLQKAWTFRNFSKKYLSQQLFIYFSLAFISLFLNTSWMYLLVVVWAWWYILAQILIALILAIINFFAYQFLVLGRKK